LLITITTTTIDLVGVINFVVGGRSDVVQSNPDLSTESGMGFSFERFYKIPKDIN